MRINEVKLPVTAGKEEIFAAFLKKSGLKRKSVKYFRLLKKSIDARDKNDIKFVYSAEISDRETIDEPVLLPRKNSGKKVVIVGFGPCGMFCALYLARAGFSPVVLERGKAVSERQRSVSEFFGSGKLDGESNVQFGEGGAGAFSDGKLNTGVSGPYIRAVLNDLIKFGAPEEIGYLAKPHVGSDNLPKVVTELRKEIERLGGKVVFNSKFLDFTVKNGKISSVIADTGEYSADALVLAIGHSARDTFAALRDKGVPMERKPFAMGLRIEHLARDIDLAQYGEKFAGVLPAADYSLVSHRGERGIFTFCMCPGGFVVPSASEEGGVVTNGMSLFARNGKNSNSAVLCEIRPSDFYEGILGGVELQRDLERKAFLYGGSDYRAPAQTFGSFLSGKTDEKFGKVAPTYALGVKFADFNEILPKFMSDGLKVGIKDMGGKMKCFSDSDALLTGVETRSSSPVRILRGDDMESPFAENFYPCGEGCGYAGGIMSAAIDGIKVALSIAEKG